MYDENFIKPMREELTSEGFTELRTPSEVDRVFGASQDTLLLVVNSMCGCAAGGARPGVIQALQNQNRPKTLVTVFAGQDTDATARAREYITGYPPSSPSVALFKNGKLVYMLERSGIEGYSAEEIAETLSTAFESHCQA